MNNLEKALIDTIRGTKAKECPINAEKQLFQNVYDAVNDYKFIHISEKEAVRIATLAIKKVWK